MSRRLPIGAGVCAAVVLCACALVTARAGSAQPRESLIAATDSLFAETSALRQLPILRPVRSRLVTRAEIEQFAVRKFDEQMTSADAGAAELLLAKLGIVPRGFAYRAFVIGLIAEQAAGVYDPSAAQLLLPDWLDLRAQQPVLVHELTHALQDQHFDLGRLERWPDGDSDAQLAARSIVEGDASLTMAQYLLSKPGQAADLLKAADKPMPALMGAPEALRESLIFPYQQGLLFAAALFAQGGWQAVTAAVATPPRSTEQVLHVEKFHAGEAPVRVDLPDLRPILGRGWTRRDYDVHGEWGYHLILNQFLNAPAESARAAAGWGGDRYALYAADAPGDVLLAQLSAWDTEQDAREFFEAYVARTRRRYPGSRPPAASEPSRGGAAHERLETSEGVVVIERRGARVLAIEGIPASVDAASLVRAVWSGARVTP